MTTARATTNFSLNSPTASRMFSAWSEILVKLTPSGRSCADGLASRSSAAAKRQPVPAALHDHAEFQRRLPAVEDLECRRILVAALDGGELAESQGAAVGGDRRRAQRLDVVVTAVDAHVDTAGPRVSRSPAPATRFCFCSASNSAGAPTPRVARRALSKRT